MQPPEGSFQDLEFYYLGLLMDEMTLYNPISESSEKQNLANIPLTWVQAETPPRIKIFY